MGGVVNFDSQTSEPVNLVAVFIPTNSVLIGMMSVLADLNTYDPMDGIPLRLGDRSNQVLLLTGIRIVNNLSQK
jgi:hypothetical protein